MRVAARIRDSGHGLVFVEVARAVAADPALWWLVTGGRMREIRLRYPFALFVIQEMVRMGGFTRYVTLNQYRAGGGV